MTSVTVAISTVSDGTMYNRLDAYDKEVVKNRETFLEKQHISLDQTTRVKIKFDREDYCRYTPVNEKDKGAGMRDDDVVIADALITTDFNHALMLPVADCIGTVMYDEEHHVLMVTHLGRHSIEQEGAKKSVEYLIEHYHSDPARLKIWMSPAAGKDNYPLWALDNKSLKEVAYEQFHITGVVDENVTDNSIETDKDPLYFSHSEFIKGHRQEDGDHMIVAMMRD